MSKLIRKPSQLTELDAQGRFQKFNLKENPFPSEPIVNKDSTDKRINGDIFEIEIRKKEYEQVETIFLKQSQATPNHLRLGYIIDTSYIGRGNGKSAFLVNLQNNINREYCIDISDGVNKCFAIYVTPEPGGRTKTFPSFVDLLFQAILRADIIPACLSMLRIDAISELYKTFNIQDAANDEDIFISDLNSKEWFLQNNFDLGQITEHIFRNKYLQDLPPYFPLFEGRSSLIKTFVTQSDFEKYYQNLKKGKDRIDFVFSHLVRFFQASGFNGAYILVDDFERIPDFQSSRQKKDFALELRACLFDGLFINARVGFYNFLLVLHAGVPRLISEAWAESGMENRAPILPHTNSKHIIPFEKLSKEHASLLLIKYLSEFRIDKMASSPLSPFTDGAVSKIGELSEYNAAKILKMAYDLLDKAADIKEQTTIDDKFVLNYKGDSDDTPDKSLPTIKGAESIDLLKKTRSTE
jgi:hypothetical protein